MITVNGNIQWTERDADGVITREWQTQNTMTSGGLALIAAWMAGNPVALSPHYVALGSGTLTAGWYATTVPGETFRTSLVAVDPAGPAAVYHFFVAALDQDNNQFVGTVGLFGGAATNQADTGTLIAIANEPFPFGKDATKSYQGDWTMTVSGLNSSALTVTSGGVARMRDFLLDLPVLPPRDISVGAGSIGRFYTDLVNQTKRFTGMAEQVGLSTIFRAFVDLNALDSTSASNAGLWTGDGLLFAAQTFTQITFDPNYTYQLVWPVAVSGIVGE